MSQFGSGPIAAGLVQGNQALAAPAELDAIADFHAPARGVGRESGFGRSRFNPDRANPVAA